MYFLIFLLLYSLRQKIATSFHICSFVDPLSRKIAYVTVEPASLSILPTQIY